MNEPFDEGFIVRYLLGDLTEQEQIEVEDRAFSDPLYLRNIQAVEADLIDEYVRAGLSEPERRRFEKRFLASHERRQKVEFARALADVATSAVITAPVGRLADERPPVRWWAPFIGLLHGSSPAVRFSLAAASLLLIITGSWLIGQTMRMRGELARLQAEQQALRTQQRGLEDEAAGERARNDALAAELQREREQRERSEELARQLQEEGERLARPQELAPVASLMLLPGVSRGSANRPRLVVPEAVRLARFQIGLEREDDYKSFRVELRTARGQEVWRQDNLRPRQSRAGRLINLTVTANILDTGEYELALKGTTDDQRIEDVRYYYFSIARVDKQR